MKNKIIDYLRQNKYGLIFVGIVFLVTIPFYIDAKIKFNKIEKNGKIGIGKFVEYKRYPKSRNYFFEYYNGNKKVKDFITKAPNGFSKRIGKFFGIKYLDQYEDIIVNYDKEITDTTLILEAGFTREDLDKAP